MDDQDDSVKVALFVVLGIITLLLFGLAGGLGLRSLNAKKAAPAVAVALPAAVGAAGAADEMGDEFAYGTTVNVPFPPGVGDEGYLQAFRKVLAPAALQSRSNFSRAALSASVQAAPAAPADSRNKTANNMRIFISHPPQDGAGCPASAKATPRGGSPQRIPAGSQL